jgi:hypothetical protein
METHVSEKIEPALTPEEWNRPLRPSIASPSASSGTVVVDTYIADAARRVPAAIAILNQLLPDSDPRKITRATVQRLRRTAYDAPDGYSGPTWLADLADALESYLPPE